MIEVRARSSAASIDGGTGAPRSRALGPGLRAVGPLSGPPGIAAGPEPVDGTGSDVIGRPPTGLPGTWPARHVETAFDTT